MSTVPAVLRPGRPTCAVLALLLPAGLGYGCGYGFGPAGGGARAIDVGKIGEPGIDVDVAAAVDIAVRHALARTPSTRLATRGEADATLEVDVVNSAAGLAPMADPGMRAAQYRAVVLVKGRLIDRGGKVIWSSAPVVGEAPFLSTPGPMVNLDGARRAALARAADQAASRLVASMNWR